MLTRLVGGTLVAAALLVTLDLRRPADGQWSARVVVAAIHAYRSAVGPYLGTTCRFTPTCSRYIEAVIERHGLATGLWRGARRLARCGPWTPLGTVDPPVVARSDAAGGH